jgi:hypothetical protein
MGINCPLLLESILIWFRGFYIRRQKFLAVALNPHFDIPMMFHLSTTINSIQISTQYIPISQWDKNQRLLLFNIEIWFWLQTFFSIVKFSYKYRNITSSPVYCVYIDWYSRACSTYDYLLIRGLLIDLSPAQEFFTSMERSPLPAKGCKI